MHFFQFLLNYLLWNFIIDLSFLLYCQKNKASKHDWLYFTFVYSILKSTFAYIYALQLRYKKWNFIVKLIWLFHFGLRWLICIKSKLCFLSKLYIRYFLIWKQILLTALFNHHKLDRQQKVNNVIKEKMLELKILSHYDSDWLNESSTPSFMELEK